MWARLEAFLPFSLVSRLLPVSGGPEVGHLQHCQPPAGGPHASPRARLPPAQHGRPGPLPQVSSDPITVQCVPHLGAGDCPTVR